MESRISNEGLGKVRVWASDVPKVNSIASTGGNEPSIGRKTTMVGVMG